MIEKPLDLEDIKTTLEIGKKWNATWFVPDDKRDEKLLEEMEKTKWIKIERIKLAVQGLLEDVNKFSYLPHYSLNEEEPENVIDVSMVRELIKKWFPELDEK